MPKAIDPTTVPKQLQRQLLRLVMWNLLIATWNLRELGDLTKKWRAGPGDTPRRDLFDVRCIAEILSRFDVVAVQEVQGNLRALRYILKALGPHWGFLLTDANYGTGGDRERLAFLFDTRTVKPSGLACELVIPPGRDVTPERYRQQFARTPYAVAFAAGPVTFILVTAHILYGKKKDPERLRELVSIARWLRWFAGKELEFGQNLILLGDFNIDRAGDELFRAFTSTGLVAPEALNAVPRTVLDVPKKPKLRSFYDQIAWFRGARGVDLLNLEVRRAGSFDFSAVVGVGVEPRVLSFKMSDHLPLWVEFGVGEAQGGVA
jgi:endonuclease/exonuclease/phosphatase family metal-dependent hydrolase